MTLWHASCMLQVLPREDKPDELMEREQEAMAMLCECRPISQIQRHLMDKFGVSASTAYADIKAVYQYWSTRGSPELESRREHMRQSIQTFYQKAMQDGAYGPALQALDRLCKIDGLYAPTRTEFQVNPGQGIEEAAPERIRERIKAFLIKHPELVPPKESN